MRDAKHSSTLHLEASQLCNSNYLFVSSCINAILKHIENSGSSKDSVGSFCNFSIQFHSAAPFLFLCCKLEFIILNLAEVIFISPEVLKGLATSRPTTLEQTVIKTVPSHEGVRFCPPFVSDCPPAYQHHIRLVCIEPQPVGS